MPAKRTPRFDAPGRALFDSTIRHYQLDSHELQLLTQAAHCVDRMDLLQTQIDRDGLTAKRTLQGPLLPHPLLAELRQQQIVYARLMTALRLPTGLQGDVVRGPQRDRPTAFEVKQQLRGVPGGLA